MRTVLSYRWLLQQDPFSDASAALQQAPRISALKLVWKPGSLLAPSGDSWHVWSARFLGRSAGGGSSGGRV